MLKIKKAIIKIFPHFELVSKQLRSKKLLITELNLVGGKMNGWMKWIDRWVGGIKLI
jgi:hypothetical protein